MMIRVLVLFSIAVGAVVAQPAATIEEWDARRDLPALPDKIKKILPVLQQLNPHEWVAKGASDAYVQQWKSVQDEVGYLQTNVETLAKQPDRLTVALDVLFRLQAIDTRLGNLIEGIRKYQNPALADMVQWLAGQNGAVRVGLQQYIQEVATQREAEWKVMESEAQRCRAQQITAPSSRKQ